MRLLRAEGRGSSGARGRAYGRVQEGSEKLPSRGSSGARGRGPRWPLRRLAARSGCVRRPWQRGASALAKNGAQARARRAAASGRRHHPQPWGAYSHRGAVKRRRLTALVDPPPWRAVSAEREQDARLRRRGVASASRRRRTPLERRDRRRVAEVAKAEAERRRRGGAAARQPSRRRLVVRRLRVPHLGEARYGEMWGDMGRSGCHTLARRSPSPALASSAAAPPQPASRLTGVASCRRHASCHSEASAAAPASAGCVQSISTCAAAPQSARLAPNTPLQASAANSPASTAGSGSPEDDDRRPPPVVGVSTAVSSQRQLLPAPPSRVRSYTRAVAPTPTASASPLAVQLTQFTEPAGNGPSVCVSTQGSARERRTRSPAQMARRSTPRSLVTATCCLAAAGRASDEIWAVCCRAALCVPTPPSEAARQLTTHMPFSRKK